MKSTHPHNTKSSIGKVSSIHPSKNDDLSPLERAALNLNDEERAVVLSATEPTLFDKTMEQRAAAAGLDRWDYLTALSRPQVQDAIFAIQDARLRDGLSAVEAALKESAQMPGRNGHNDRALMLRMVGREHTKPPESQKITNTISDVVARKEAALKAAARAGIRVDRAEDRPSTRTKKSYQQVDDDARFQVSRPGDHDDEPADVPHF